MLLYENLNQNEHLVLYLTLEGCVKMEKQKLQLRLNVKGQPILRWVEKPLKVVRLRRIVQELKDLKKQP
jgi:hypothetical protein